MLLDIEISKLPSTMQAAAQYSDMMKLKGKEREIDEEIFTIKQILYKKERIRNNIRSDIRNMNENKDINAKFILPCPHEDCRGFLSTAYKCEICKMYSCSKCITVIGDKKINETHICDEDAVKTAEFIKNTTKPCPGCGERIMKIEGCDQMWCTVSSCHTVFNWRTLKIDNSGMVHNPHYYDWQKNNTGLVMREPGDVVCGGLPQLYQIDTKICRGKFRSNYCESVEWRNNIRNMHRLTAHFTYHEVPNLRNRINLYNDFKSDRILYINKIISKEQFANNISRKDKIRKKHTDILYIYETISTVFIDTFIHIRNILNGDLSSGKQEEMLNIKIEEMHKFVIYCNKQIQKISALNSATLIQILDNFTFIKQKFKMSDIKV